MSHSWVQEQNCPPGKCRIARNLKHISRNTVAKLRNCWLPALSAFLPEISNSFSDTRLRIHWSSSGCAQALEECPIGDVTHINRNRDAELGPFRSVKILPKEGGAEVKGQHKSRKFYFQNKDACPKHCDQGYTCLSEPVGFQTTNSLNLRAFSEMASIIRPNGSVRSSGVGGA